MTNPSTYRLTEEALKARIALEKATGKTASFVISEALVEKYSCTFASPIIELSLLDPTEYADLIAGISKLESIHKNSLRKWRKVSSTDKNILHKITDQIETTNKEINKLRHLRLQISCFAKLQSSLKADDLQTLDTLKSANIILNKNLKVVREKHQEEHTKRVQLEEENANLQQQLDDLKSSSKEQISFLKQQRDAALATCVEYRENNATASKIALAIEQLSEDDMRQLQWAVDGFHKQVADAKNRNSSDAAPYEAALKIITPILS